MKAATSLAQCARGTALHSSVRAVVPKPVGPRPNLADVLSPEVNAVLVAREPRALPSRALAQLVRRQPKLLRQVSVDTKDSASKEAAVGKLLDRLLPDDPDAHRFLRDDILDLVQVFGQQLGYDRVHVKLEVICSTKCPRWHADHVTLRCLCTYTGEGTLFIENRHVKRTWEWHEGELLPVVESVDDSFAQQAATGDLLMLKGHKWGGNFLGLGVVHRSPEACLDTEAAAGSPSGRLLLTVDDAFPCDCGVEH